MGIFCEEDGKRELSTNIITEIFTTKDDFPQKKK